MNFSRKKRIAKGSGLPVEMVSNLVKQFETMRKMMKQNGLLGRLMAGGGQVPDSGMGLNGFFNSPAPISKKAQDHKKRIAKLAKKQRAKQRKRK